MHAANTELSLVVTSIMSRTHGADDEHSDHVCAAREVNFQHARAAVGRDASVAAFREQTAREYEETDRVRQKSRFESVNQRSDSFSQRAAIHRFHSRVLSSNRAACLPVADAARPLQRRQRHRSLDDA